MTECGTGRLRAAVIRLYRNETNSRSSWFGPKFSQKESEK